MKILSSEISNKNYLDRSYITMLQNKNVSMLNVLNQNQTKITNRCYLPSFGSNVAIYTEMKQLVYSAKPDINKLKKLFEGLSSKAQENFNVLLKKIENYDVTFEDLLLSCAKQVQIFYQSPETVETKIQDVVRRFEQEGLNLKDYIQACIKNPILFCQSPETIEKNVRDVVKIFEKDGLNSNTYIQACIKQPKLFSRSPKTIEKNVRDVVKIFEKEGLNTKDYIKACIKTPSVFCLPPETIEKNVRDVVKIFEKDGLNTKDYIKSCIKQPSLFYQSPETIEKNVRDVVKIFEKDGLNTKDYIKSCIKQPALFYQSPETIEKNVRELVKKFEDKGLEVVNYIDVCKAYPQLLCLSPVTVAEHINAYIYIEKHKKAVILKDIINSVLKRNLCYSTSLIYLKKIVEPQLNKNYPRIKDIDIPNIKNKLKFIFEQNPNTQFEIKILKDEMAENFIKVIQDFAENELKAPNAFKIKEVPFEML